MSQYNPKFDLKLDVGTVTYISQSSNFALYLEEYFMYKHQTYGLCQYDPKFDTKINANVGHRDLYFLL